MNNYSLFIHHLSYLGENGRLALLRELSSLKKEPISSENFDSLKTRAEEIATKNLEELKKKYEEAYKNVESSLSDQDKETFKKACKIHLSGTTAISRALDKWLAQQKRELKINQKS